MDDLYPGLDQKFNTLRRLLPTSFSRFHEYPWREKAAALTDDRLRFWKGDREIFGGCLGSFDVL